MALSPYDPRWDPWGDMRSLRERMNRMLETSFSWPGSLFAGDREVPLDVTETDGEYRIEASLPGMKPEDVKVTVENNVVTIAGERREARERKEGERVTHSEHRYGRFERSFSLGSAVNADQCRADFEDGVLRLTLPKSETARAKQIPVRATPELTQAQATQRQEVEAPITST
ncbi:MAG: Hsp20/alpha crystallin family protein, partial [Chloroflexota bacterium]